MCEPTTIAVVGSVAGGLLKANAAKNAAEVNATILRQNARTAEYGAVDAIDRGNLAEGKQALAAGALEDRQRQQFAASGVDVTSGSAVDVVASTEGLSQLERLILRNNAQKEAWGYKTQASNFRYQADAGIAAAQSAATGSILGGVGGAATYGAPTLRVK